MNDKTEFRAAVESAVRDAADRGDSYQDIMAGLATVMGCLVAAGSENRETRLKYVKASMSVVAAVIDRQLH